MDELIFLWQEGNNHRQQQLLSVKKVYQSVTNSKREETEPVTQQAV